MRLLFVYSTIFSMLLCQLAWAQAQIENTVDDSAPVVTPEEEPAANAVDVNDDAEDDVEDDAEDDAPPPPPQGPALSTGTGSGRLIGGVDAPLSRLPSNDAMIGSGYTPVTRSRSHDTPSSESGRYNSGSSYQSGYRDNRRSDRCFINGRWVSHGTEAPVSSRNPCWVKLCWYGRLHERRDGCFYEGECRPLNRDFTYQCTTFSCTKQNTGPTSYRYSTEIVRHGCEDSRGACYRPGDRRTFGAYIRGRFYNTCSCQYEGGYTCYNEYY